MRVVDLDGVMFVPVVDETHGGAVVEMKMTVGEFFEKCCAGFAPEAVEAIPVAWLVQQRDKLRAMDCDYQAGLRGFCGVRAASVGERTGGETGMKRIAITAMLLAVVTLAGCSTMGKVDSQKIAEAEIDNRMFMVVSEESSGRVLVDKSTGVMYWASDNSYNRGNLTLLVNPDGTPRIWEG